MLTEELLFPTPIWWTELGLNVEDLTSLCYKMRDESTDSSQRSNLGGWQSIDMDGEAMLSNPDSFGELARAIKNVGVDVHNKFRPHGTTVRLANIWININKGEDLNITHTHPGSVVSGVYYVKTPPDCGRISFHRDHHSSFCFASAGAMMSACEGGEDTPWMWSQFSYPPIHDRLMLFPAWLAHGVEPGKPGIEDRISISFNLVPEYSDKEAYYGGVTQHHGV